MSEVARVEVLKERLKRLAAALVADVRAKVLEKMPSEGSFRWKEVLLEWVDTYMAPFGLTVFNVGYGDTIDVKKPNDADLKNVMAVVLAIANDVLPICPDYAEEILSQVGFFVVAAARAKYLLRRDLRVIPRPDEAAVMPIIPQLIKYTQNPDDTVNPAYTDYEPNSWDLKFTPGWQNIKTIYHAYVFGADGPKYWRPSREARREFVIALAANHLIGVAEPLEVRVFRVASREWSAPPAEGATQFVDISKDENKMLYIVRRLPAILIDYDIASGLIEELVLPNPTGSTEPIKKNVRVIGLAFVNYERVADIRALTAV